MIKISNRLITVASLVSEVPVLADVGTDHGYVPIYLIEQKKIKKAIALDINRGPLQRARDHTMLFNMGQYIETRLSDGVEALTPGEADSILIAGMGGGLVMHILENGSKVCQTAKELVLQPQSEIRRVRRFLAIHGYVTDAEEMVFEDGKYYPMMRVHYDRNAKLEENPQLGYIYGMGLLKQQHPVLLEYLKNERQTYQGIYESLKQRPNSGNIVKRLKDIEDSLEENERALAFYR